MKVTIKLDQEQFDFINTSLVTIASQLTLLVRAWEGETKEEEKKPEILPRTFRWTNQIENIIVQGRNKGYSYQWIKDEIEKQTGNVVTLNMIYSRAKHLRDAGIKIAGPTRYSTKNRREHYVSEDTIFRHSKVDKQLYKGTLINLLRNAIKDTQADYIIDTRHYYINKKDQEAVEKKVYELYLKNKMR